MDQGINIEQLVKSRKGPKKKRTGKSLGEFLNKDIEYFKKGFSDLKKEKFYSELHVLFNAGLDIRSILELIESEQADLLDRELIRSIKDSLVKGNSMSDSMISMNKFTDYEIFSVKIGEETGRLNQVFKDLAGYFNRKIKQKRQVTSALSYPVIVLTTVTGVMIFMMKVMVPMFTEMFKRFKGELPVVTKIVIYFSEIIGNSFYYLLFSFLVFSIFVYSQRKKDYFRGFTSRLLLKIPFVGELIRKVYLGRFAHSMSLLLGARIPITNAIEMVRKMIDFYPIEVSLDQIKKDLLAGISFSTSLSGFEIYNKRFISLVKVGEEVNQLDTMFEKLNIQFNDEVEHKTSMLGSLLEPILILVLGFVVAFILIAMYLPIFQLSTSVGN